MCIKENVTNAVIEGKASKVKSLVEVALQLGLPQKEIIDSMLAGMEIIGEKFKQDRLYIPDVMMSGRAMQAGFYVLEPMMKATQDSKPRVMIGTVAGDLHDIGKDLIILTLKGAGIEAIDLGIDVSPDAFVEAVKEHKPDVLGLSALLTITTPMLEKTIQTLENNNVRKGLKIVVGGGPVSPNYANKIGADGYASDAYEAVDVIKSLLNSAITS